MPLTDTLTFETARMRHEMDFYAQAFHRNLGLISRADQERLRRACVAIPGLGGVGSAAALSLARTGIGKFRLADFARHSTAHTNSQFGAAGYTMGRNKAEVMAEQIAAINPEAHIKIFTEPITDFNIDQFLEGADVVVDGLDLFTPETRSLLYRKAREAQRYVVMSTALGFGAALLIFSPRGMSFDDYFHLKGKSYFEDKILYFLMGVAPGGLQHRYLPERFIDFARKRLPTFGSAAQLAGALSAGEAVNILLARRAVKAAPYYFQFDPYLMRLKRGYLWRGNRNPLQRLRFLFSKYRLGKKG